MKSTRDLLLASMALLLAAGCGHGQRSSLPGHLVDPIRFPHASCPTASHLAAVGVHGRGVAAAERDGQVRLVEQIAVTIKGQTRTVLTSTADGDEVEVSESFQQEIETEARFSHVELIQRVGASGTERGRVHVLVCLNRAAGVAAIERDMEPHLSGFASARQRFAAAGGGNGRRGRSQGGIFGLVNRGMSIARGAVGGVQANSAYVEASRHFRQLLPLFVQYRGLRRRSHPQQQGTFRDMAAMRAGARSATPLGLGAEVGMNAWLDAWDRAGR